MFSIKNVKTQAVAFSIAGTIALSSVLGPGMASADVPPREGPVVGDYIPHVPPQSMPSPEKPAVHIRSICDVSPIFCDPLLYERVVITNKSVGSPARGSLSEAAVMRLRILEKLPQVEAVTAAKVKTKAMLKAEAKAKAQTKTKTSSKTKGKTNPKAISPVPVPTSKHR